MSTNKKIAVLGGGSWATALIKILSNNATELLWWMRNQDAVNYIKETKHNPNYMSSVPINTEIVNVISDLKTACEKADIIVLAVPSAFVHKTLSSLQINLSSKVFFSAVKGIFLSAIKLLANTFKTNTMSL